MRVGIDKIGLFTPNKYVDVVDLAYARNEDPNKYLIGIGQSEMSVADQTQDAVSMGINATMKYIDRIDKDKIGLLVFGTESGIDQSKSASLFVKTALKLKPEVRTFEVKEACFGLTAALMIARDFVRVHPDQTAMVIGSDIARYGIGTAGEVTQGAGSVSMLIKADPAILALNDGHSAYSEDINDFWRPNDSKLAMVDGKYSTQVYLDFFSKTFADYKKQKKLETNDFDAIIYHLPFTKMGLKANRLAVADQDEATTEKLQNSFDASKQLSRRVGNIYTASLYMSLLSLLENGNLPTGALVGLFSYGSGAMGEFYSGNLVEGYKKEVNAAGDEKMLKRRQKVSVPEYEEIFNTALDDPEDNEELTSDDEKGTWYFAGTKGNIRQYKVK
ncbi:hydroxymethylglutaryl-CoA synthase [Lactobacillus helveticus]|uniref:Hydroxymethylglutaryl-CoA synthase n=1 Tax=Lactobacillus helveticus CIRM-BIA 104 TaxID=1226333 RepID=U6FEZ3_LACHE|nr:hydroxymethylglutaryl-CoA synthase [Lactobacillus helveticus]AUJ27323.1 hydroxymethylglutaryl-CoA synthase [Lactobacillus helveticus]AZA22079.1 MAG: hydroxymethylglutaryl-CoA synthase [Lactobacillus helveticus]EEW67605.1 hydroxymethylglutaryl-CoA synthase [Lactobacillus helveticus DSM 20075 = CGMCC 1.1877]KGL04326.1 hydroxymethylglutaryl-CoA synthase [Lactobacillus helveticus]KGL06010.1 hydroxymethylglutaryl-CoA synthase [Lactobacillus helveticus]